MSSASGSWIPVQAAILLLLVSVLAQTAGTTDCTQPSFLTPAFTITELKYANDKTGSFRLTNIANNYSATVVCQFASGQCQSQGDTTTRTQVSASLDGNSVQVAVNQSWVCDDTKWNNTVPIRLDFTATGTTTMPTICGQDGTCTSSRRITLIRATLVSPMAGTPPYLDPLDGQRASDCQNPRAQPLWNARNAVWFDRYRQCIGGPPNPLSGGGSICFVNGIGLTLDLYNSVLNSSVRCDGVMIRPGQTTGEFPLYCEEPIWPRRKYYTQTNVLLLREKDTNTSSLQVNQTWQCDQDGQDRPTQITAHGTATVPLTCSTTTGVDQNFFTTPQPWRETNCNGPDTPIGRSSLSSTTLPAYALEEPQANDPTNRQPEPGTCLRNHLNLTGLDIDLFAYTLYVNNSTGTVTSAEVGFFANHRDLEGANNAVSMPLLPGTNQTDGTKWLDCYPPAWNATKPCQFQYDSALGRFTLRRFTQCNDVDRQHPYLMTVTTNFTLPPLDCSWKDYYPEADRGKIIRCRWQADPRYPVYMPITSLDDITWLPMPPGWPKNLWDGEPWKPW